MKKYIFWILFVFLVLPNTVSASWPSSEKVLQTLAPIAGLDEDEVEAVRFSLKYPQCSATITSYTISQDYSLIGFIGALKTSKLSNLPSLTPLKKSNCKKTNPTQRAYRFIEDQGDALLGKETASLLKDILSEQIAQGKSELDAQVASIPYVGTILTHWDCACDAAFETDFPAETLVDTTVGAVVRVLENIKKNNITTAIEILIANFGPDTTCSFLSKHSGVGGIPIVSDLANQTCSSLLSAPLGFVVSGVGDVAQALGIAGYDHVSPDEYYKNYMVSEIGVSNYMKKADALYTQCYAYFEPSSMSSETAKKACILLRQRYIDESIAKIEWIDAGFARVEYYKNNIQSKAAKGIFTSEQDFQKEILNQITICESYFKARYPKALTFQYAEKQFCSPKDVENMMWEARKKAQQNYVSTALPYTEPFCDYRTAGKTALGCSKEGAPLCKQYLSANACMKSAKYPGGVDVPCCQIDSSAVSKGFVESKKKTEQFANDLDGGIYCKTDNPSNPLQISCSLKEAYVQCQKKIGAESLKSCATTDYYKSGVSKYQCCQYTPEKLYSVQGTQTAKNFVEIKNAQVPYSCTLGGLTEGFDFDPRIVRCAQDVQVSQCKAIFYKECSFNVQGYTTNGCCVKDPFGGTGNATSVSSSTPARNQSRTPGVGFLSSIKSVFTDTVSAVRKIFVSDSSKNISAPSEKRESMTPVAALPLENSTTTVVESAIVPQEIPARSMPGVSATTSQTSSRMQVIENNTRTLPATTSVPASSGYREVVKVPESTSTLQATQIRETVIPENTQRTASTTTTGTEVVVPILYRNIVSPEPTTRSTDSVQTTSTTTVRPLLESPIISPIITPRTR